MSQNLSCGIRQLYPFHFIGTYLYLPRVAIVTNPALKNILASVREKLRNIARQRNADFGLILVKYGLERILFRLSRSAYHDVFALKGALLFELWTGQQYRPTRDADFLARGETRRSGFFGSFENSVRRKPNPMDFASIQIL